MSGLFARMAQRTRGGDTGDVRLLVPTLFEPEVESPAQDQPPERLENRAAHRATGERTSAATTVALASDARATSRAPEPSPTSANDATAITVRVEEPTRSDQPLVSPAPPPTHARVCRQRDATRDPDPRHASLPSTSDRTSVRTDGDVTADRARPRALDRAPGDELTARAHAPTTGARGDEPHEGDDDELLVAPTSPRRTAERPGRRDAPSIASARPPRDATSDARPIVKVTIGRIDVRPSPNAPTTPPPRAARHQAMGLDEYLKRRDARDGGAR